MHRTTVWIISGPVILLEPSAPAVPLLYSYIRLDDQAKLHYTSKQFELQSSSHSSAKNEIGQPTFCSYYQWILPNAIMAENAGLPAKA